MDISLKGKTALVTGASGGIGGAIALQLAKAGAIVAVHYASNRQRGQDTVSAIEREGGSAFALGADLRDFGKIEPLFAALHTKLAEYGTVGLDILVNNAGEGLPGDLAGTTEADYDRIMDLNVKAMFFTTRAALPHLHDGGAIINISSMVSIVAYPGAIAYSLSKAAVNSFTRSLAADLGPRRIRVNAVAPGATATEFIAEILKNPDAVAALKRMTAFGRVGETGDIAQVVAFLASPASAWITGQVIQASGGMHL